MYVRSSSIGEQNGNLVNGLGHKAEEIPECIRILQIALRIALLCVNKVGKLDRVPDEENWRIVPNHIPVP